MNSAILPPRLCLPWTRRLLAASRSTAASQSRRTVRTAPSASPPFSTSSAPCCFCLHRPAASQHVAPIASFPRFSTSATSRSRSSRPEEPPAEPLQPADDPNFTSILDNPPELVRSGRRHGPGVLILVLIPVAAFALGTWQVYRLRWKTDMLAKCEDRLVRPPLPLGLQNVHDAAEVSATGDASDFDYRRIVSVGSFRHDQEMLVGPRMRDGEVGFLVVTPFELAVPTDGSVPDDVPPATILVNRGWIARDKRAQVSRSGSSALPEGLVRIEGLLRAPWKRNMFTPDNKPEKGEFYFPDVQEMAKLTGSLPVWIEATMEPDLLQVYDMGAKGVPIGRPAEVNIRNQHAQYIFTWYSLCVATSIMLWMVVRKPPSDIARRVRMNKSW